MPYLQTDKPHRPSRRRLGRGRHPTAPPVATTITAFHSTARINFSQPVVVRGLINLTIDTVTAISQTIDSATQVTITFTAPTYNHAYSLPSPPTNVQSVYGGIILGETGETIMDPDVVLHSAGGNYYPPANSDVKNGVQFGVGNTGSTGTYVPPPPTYTNVASITDNLDGTFDIQFDAQVTMLQVAHESMFQFYDSAQFAFVSSLLLLQVDPTTIRVSPDGGTGGPYTIFILLDAPVHVTSPNPFQWAHKTLLP